MLPAINNRKVKPRKQIQSFGVGKPFNPLTFDSANLLALYNGDLGLSNILWEDQGSGGHDIVLNNNPGVFIDINGHQVLGCNGISQNGSVGTPAVVQPYTIYIVFNQITWTGNDRIFDDGVTSGAGTLFQLPVSPDLTFRATAGAIATNPDVALNTYDILTIVVNGAASQIRTNNNVAVVGNAGAGNRQGITIASSAGLATGFANAKYAYIVLRNGVDSLATQNLFINYFKTRFAI